MLSGQFVLVWILIQVRCDMWCTYRVKRVSCRGLLLLPNINSRISIILNQNIFFSVFIFGKIHRCCYFIARLYFSLIAPKFITFLTPAWYVTHLTPHSQEYCQCVSVCCMIRRWHHFNAAQTFSRANDIVNVHIDAFSPLLPLFGLNPCFTQQYCGIRVTLFYFLILCRSYKRWILCYCAGITQYHYYYHRHHHHHHHHHYQLHRQH